MAHFITEVVFYTGYLTTIFFVVYFVGQFSKHERWQHRATKYEVQQNNENFFGKYSVYYFFSRTNSYFILLLGKLCRTKSYIFILLWTALCVYMLVDK